MIESRLRWKRYIFEALLQLGGSAAAGSGGSQSFGAMDGPEAVVAENPPKPELGEIGFPMFSYAKALKKSPAAIASEIQALLGKRAEHEPLGGVAKAIGPYVNIFLDKSETVSAMLSRGGRQDWNDFKPLAGKRIMVEFSCPNTNKPLHLGHLRNNVLGESLSRILKEAGAEVRKVNLINDRGVHICKSMLAYQSYGGDRTPEDEGLKSDHFVGRYYVKFNELKKEDPAAEERAQELLRRWEAGEPEVIALWKRMNEWAVEGIRETYSRQGVSFDAYYFESLTYTEGKAEILDGLDRGIFYRDEDGSVWVNLEDVGLDKKVLLRKDGTSLYITQDIGTAILRHRDWPFERLVYVVASEQQYHFKVLFEILRRLGHEWASQLHHLSYGLVNLPSGRMKTREGTVVDADDLIDELAGLAKAEIEGKGRDSLVENPGEISEKVALGALHYYLLQTSPVKDMLYDPEQSLSFTGDTGPYIQYMGARACSILRKHEKGEGNAGGLKANPQALSGEADWTLVRRLAAFPDALEAAARSFEPSILAAYAHDTAADFSAWYRDNPVLSSPSAELSASRVELVRAVKSTLETLCRLLCIPFLEAM